MCGIFGVVTPNPSNQSRHDFATLAILNEERGRDSWGLYANKNTNGKPYIFKALGTPSKLYTFSLRSLRDRLVNATVLLGHTRAASCGKINVYNAHPFRFGHIIGAHNGIITNYQDLAEKYNLGNISVDSEVIFLLIRNFGVHKLSELEGYASIWWVNTYEPNTFYLWCSHNTLYTAVRADTLAFSSDSRHLIKADFPSPELLEEHRIYRITETGTITPLESIPIQSQYFPTYRRIPRPKSDLYLCETPLSWCPICATYYTQDVPCDCELALSENHYPTIPTKGRES